MDFWDARFDEETLAYGGEPNDWLAEVAAELPDGPALELAAGQGRNAVWLAGRGHDTTAVDQSAVGLRRASELAARRGVALRTEQVDLTTWDPGAGRWAVIVSVFAHMPAPARRALHRRVVDALAPGGVFVLEAYTPDQVGRGTGGPPVAELMMTLADLRTELAGLEMVRGEEVVRPVHEGLYHNGDAAVVRVLARKS
jgi:SAM-dependent methyltransferase